jgi:multidrug efflux pump subunit AcrA (membrane-fusion protein)
LDGQDGHHLEGEFLTIRERIVVAPHWGRVHQDVTDPEPVDEGVVIGRIRERGVETPLVPPEPSVLIRWLVRDGERVAPGSPIVLLLSLDGNE